MMQMMVTYQLQEDGLKHLPWFLLRFGELQLLMVMAELERAAVILDQACI